MKNKLSKGLSANPKCLIKGTFSAATDVFTSFYRKNDILKNHQLSDDYTDSPHAEDVTGLLRYARNDSKVQCGRSMIEMLGVLAIIGVLSVGGIAGYSKAMTKFKTNQIADQVSTIVTNIKTLYAQQKNYEGLNYISAFQLGVTPTELGSDLTNPFNGGVDVKADDKDINRFIVYYYGLPKEACISLVTNDWGASLSSGLVAMAATNELQTTIPNNSNNEMHIGCQGEDGDYGVYIACPGGSVLSVPMSPEKASAACACDEGNTCSVGWMYH